MEMERTGSEESHPDELRINVDGTEFIIRHPDVNGRQVLEIAGKNPPDDFIVYWLDQGNVMHDLGLDSSVHLHHHNVERFLAFNSDRSFRFEIDGKREDWGCPTITEETIRKLAGGGDDVEVWLDREGEPALLIARGQQVNLSASEIERFRLERIIKVEVVNENNGDEFCVASGKRTTIESIIADMYARLGVPRRPDDRLRCEKNGGDVFAFANLTLGQYLEAGHCSCLVWCFVGGTGGARCL